LRLVTRHAFTHYPRHFDIYSGNNGVVSRGDLFVLRSVNHLRRRLSADVVGSVVMIYQEFVIPIHNFATFVLVVPADLATSPHEHLSEENPFRVPFFMLVPPLAWPLAHVISKTCAIPVFGLPYSDTRVALQIRSINSFSDALASRHQFAGEMSSYSAGDFFELPVANALRAIILVRVYLLFSAVDSTTGTWLVRVHNLSHLWKLILPVVFLGTSVFFNLGCLPGCPFASNFQSSAIIVLDKTLRIQTMFIAYFNFAI